MVLLTVLLGFVIERAAYKPLRTAPRMSVMISAIGVSYLLQNLATYITGGLPQMYPSHARACPARSPLPASPPNMVTVITPVLVVVLVVALTQLINHTKIGMAMRAASRDFETAQLMGIKINSVISFTFIIGSLPGGGGVCCCTSPTIPSIVPLSGSLPGLRAFVAAVFGGIGSIPGAVVGAFLIGISARRVIKGSNWSVFSDAFTFALLIVILVVKPTGLFGEKVHRQSVRGASRCCKKKRANGARGSPWSAWRPCWSLVIVLENTMQPTSMLFTVLKKGAVYALVAASMNLLNGFTGLFSLGQAGFMLLGAYTYAILTIPIGRPGERCTISTTARP